MNESKYPTIKLILIGDMGVGKSSLVHRYVNDQFSPSTIHTIGLAYCQKNTVDRESGKTVDLRIWDTAGQEAYRSLVTFYIRRAQAAIICYDLGDRSSWRTVGYWCCLLHDQEPGCRIYFVGTKKDLIRHKGSKTYSVSVLEGHL